MNLQARLIGTTVMIVAGLGLTHAIASEPASQKTAQQSDVCRQAGSEYTKLYTIEEDTRSITICQKGQKYYYVTTAK
ncbi:MAG: hypothetical protein NW224_19195 [Leptolyngbyaceae cyanobacterium bins.302]|nr:hypothetical protein [Leptolyngbyaceae cyanobacterium bins.302]